MKAKQKHPISRRLIVFMGCLVLFGIGAGLVWGGPDDDEYRRKLRKLDQKDVQGHWELAVWCKEKRQWRYASDRCKHILRLEPEHTQAKLLLNLANSRLEKKRKRAEATEGSTGKSKSSVTFTRLVTEDEIQAIRRAELFRNQRDNARVRIDKSLPRDFYDAISALDGFAWSRKNFMKLSPLRKTQVILKSELAGQFADRIRITSDPDRLQYFKSTIQPLVLKGCASAKCHGGGQIKGFRLINKAKMSNEESYTNFMLLMDYKVGRENLIDRSHPRRSVLLYYGLARQEPDYFNHYSAHPVEYGGSWKVGDERYNKILSWLKALDIKRPEYGFSLYKEHDKDTSGEDADKNDKKDETS